MIKLLFVFFAFFVTAPVLADEEKWNGTITLEWKYQRALDDSLRGGMPFQKFPDGTSTQGPEGDRSWEGNLAVDLGGTRTFEIKIRDDRPTVAIGGSSHVAAHYRGAPAWATDACVPTVNLLQWLQVESKIGTQSAEAFIDSDGSGHYRIDVSAPLSHQIQYGTFFDKAGCEASAPLVQQTSRSADDQWSWSYEGESGDPDVLEGTESRELTADDGEQADWLTQLFNEQFPDYQLRRSGRDRNLGTLKATWKLKRKAQQDLVWCGTIDFEHLAEINEDRTETNNGITTNIKNKLKNFTQAQFILKADSTLVTVRRGLESTRDTMRSGRNDCRENFMKPPMWFDWKTESHERTTAEASGNEDQAVASINVADGKFSVSVTVPGTTGSQITEKRFSGNEPCGTPVTREEPATPGKWNGFAEYGRAEGLYDGDGITFQGTDTKPDGTTLRWNLKKVKADECK